VRSHNEYDWAIVSAVTAACSHTYRKVRDGSVSKLGAVRMS